MPQKKPAKFEDRLANLQSRLRVRFQNPDLLKQALIISEKPGDDVSTVQHNRFELIGDAVLALVLKDDLFDRSDEAVKALVRSYDQLASNRMLAKVSQELGLPRCAHVSDRQRWAYNTSDLEWGWHRDADLLEAFIGALYKDSGIDVVREFIRRVLWPIFIRLVPNPSLPSPQTLLQRLAVEQYGERPVYRYISRFPGNKSRSPQGAPRRTVYKFDVSVKGKIVASSVAQSYFMAHRTVAIKALQAQFGLTFEEVKQQTS